MDGLPDGPTEPPLKRKQIESIELNCIRLNCIVYRPELPSIELKYITMNIDGWTAWPTDRPTVLEPIPHVSCKTEINAYMDGVSIKENVNVF